MEVVFGPLVSGRRYGSQSFLDVFLSAIVLDRGSESQ